MKKMHTPIQSPTHCRAIKDLFSLAGIVNVVTDC